MDVVDAAIVVVVITVGGDDDNCGDACVIVAWVAAHYRWRDG
jgi:hypothetical protein